MFRMIFQKMAFKNKSLIITENILQQKLSTSAGQSVKIGSKIVWRWSLTGAKVGFGCGGALFLSDLEEIRDEVPPWTVTQYVEHLVYRLTKATLIGFTWPILVFLCVGVMPYYIQSYQSYYKDTNDDNEEETNKEGDVKPT